MRSGAALAATIARRARKQTRYADARGRVTVGIAVGATQRLSLREDNTRLRDGNRRTPPPANAEWHRALVVADCRDAD